VGSWEDQKQDNLLACWRQSKANHSPVINTTSLRTNLLGLRRRHMIRSEPGRGGAFEFSKDAGEMTRVLKSGVLCVDTCPES